MNLILFQKIATKLNLQQNIYVWLVVPVILALGLLAWYQREPVRPPTVSVVQIVPTYTPTPGVKAAAVPLTATVGAQILVPTATPSLMPTATATPKPADRLAEGLQLHRYGNYAAARTQFEALLAAPSKDLRVNLQARYALARAYMAEDAYQEAITVLDQLDTDLAANPLAKDEFQSKELFLRAEAFAGLGQQSEAIALYWRFLEIYPWMAEAVQQRVAVAYEALGDHASAAVAYRRAADATTEPVARTSLLESLAVAYNNQARYTDAVAAYEEILQIAKNADYRAYIQYQAGESLAAGGDTPGAITQWRAATTTAPTSKSAYSALVQLVNHNADFDLYQRGYIDLQQAEAITPAINAFQAYLDSAAPTDSRYGQALHGLGQAYLAAKNYSAAVETLDRVINGYPHCPCYGQAWIDKAVAQLWLDDRVGARRTYRTFAREHKDDPLASEALWQSGLYALRDGNTVEASLDFLALADAFPKSERTPLALYVLGLNAYQDKRYDQAVNAYSRLQHDYPTYSWLAVGYWLGRTYQAQGKMESARHQWQLLVQKAPDVYYGILAAQSLRQTPLASGNLLNNMAAVAGPASTLAGDDGSQPFAERWLKSWLKTPDNDVATLPAALVNDQDLRMGRLLLELDQRGDALAMLDRVFQRNKQDPRALYALSLEYAQIGAYSFSLLAMQRLLEASPAHLVENAPIFLQKHAYPRYFDELITQSAQTYKLNSLLYFSLIRQESLFEEGARSGAAAQGLAQIVPDTGIWVAQRLGHPDYTNELIYRPYINLNFGAYYLAWARDYLDGNLVSALVGYNAGPGYADEWRKTTGSDDPLFVELLNVNEPRIYVQAITTSLYHYTRLYGG